MRRFSARPGVWLAPRAFWALGAVAGCLALGAAAAAFVWLAAAAACALLVAIALDVMRGPRADALQIERTQPPTFTLGHACALEYEIVNRSPEPLWLSLVEEPVATLVSPVDELSVRAAPRSRVCAQRQVLPHQRGAVELRAIYVWYENGLGLLRRYLRIDAPARSRVYPDLCAVERYGALHVRGTLLDAGLRKMRMRGAGSEFEHLREYAVGDDFRAIDWKATARRGRVMVAQYEVERSQSIMLLLDAGRLMTGRVGDRRKLDYAVTAALAVASVAGLASDRVGVLAFARNVLVARAPRATKASVAQLASAIYDLAPRMEESDYLGAFASLRTHVRKRSLIVLFTDMVDPVAQSAVLAQIGTVVRHHVVVVVFMNDAKIDDALGATPHEPLDVYRAGVALDLRRERRAAAAVLRRTGARVVDVPAPQLSTALIDEYLRIKTRGLL